MQKTVKSIPVEGVKSNPSKRHRDRLNTELDRLASLLPFPQDVINKLDKLSVLRLSVSYLRAKSFFDVALKSPSADRSIAQENCSTKFRQSLNLQEGEFLLQALNGFVLVVTTDALVFYASSTIQDYLGFQQSDVIHQSVYELIHTEDRAEFQRQLHWAFNPSQIADSGQRIDEANGLLEPSEFYNPNQLPPESSSFMERCFICRLRCLLDNSSGFLAMNFQGRLKYLHGQNKKGKDGSILPSQLALFAIATPLQPPSILEIRTKNFIFRTKHKLDFTPTGCDAKGTLVLGYTEAELCMKGSGYQFVHAGDMLYCAECHLRMIKTGESGMTVFRLLAKGNRWTWVQSNARLVYKNGRPDYIIATQRPLTEEEGAEHLQKRSTKLPFMFTTGEAVLYELANPLHSLMEPLQKQTQNGASQDSAAKSTLGLDSLHPSSVLAALIQQDESIYHYPTPSSMTFERNFERSMNDLQYSAIPPENVFPTLEPLGQTQEVSPALSDNKNSDIYKIMKDLGIDFEDIKHMQQSEEFFRTDLSSEGDLHDIDVDEILTYVQDSLNKSAFLGSGYQQPLVPNAASCMVQESLQLEPPPPTPLQKHQATEQRQLCQKMKHMQVNGMFTSWNSAQSVPLSCSQQDLQPYLFSELPGASQGFPYKPEIATMPYTQNFIPCNQSMLPEHSKSLQHLDFPTGNFEPSLYPPATPLEDFVTCLQVNERPKQEVIRQSAMVTPQTCYSGAVSMYQCQPEIQHNSMSHLQYHPTMPSSQAFASKFPNGGALNETYAAELNHMSDPQATAQLQSLHHPTEARPFPDLTASGFL